ncbi:MAG: metallophosphoesterase [Bacteroidia bacterium]
MTHQNKYLHIGFIFTLALFLANSCDTLRNASNSAPENKTLTATNANPSFLFLSDVHLDTTTSITVSGGDTGMNLWSNCCHKIDSILSGPNPPGFIVYTGDLPKHYHCDTSCYLAPNQRASHNGNLYRILTDMRTLSSKHQTPLFYLPGNNDGLAGDYYSFADENQQTPFSLVPDSKNPYPALNILPGSTKAPCMVSNPNPTMGYYAARPVDGLRLISMNTVIFTENFTAVDGTQQQADGDTQMAWLAKQLAEAKAQNEQVYIAMHVPPGLDAYGCKHIKTDSCTSYMWVKLANQKVSWLSTFLSLTSTYQGTIAGILYGHTHMDEMRRLYDPSGTTITEVAISCPGVTPQHGNNPGFKTVTYDASSKELMDFTTYYSTISSTSWGNSSYSFSATFGAPPGKSIFQQLSGMTLSNVANSMDKIYTVKNGKPAYKTRSGIEVKSER